MKKLKIMAALVALASSGCIATDSQGHVEAPADTKPVQAGRQVSPDDDQKVTSLGDGVLSSYHPTRGERFFCSGTEELKVFQILGEKDVNGQRAKCVLAKDCRTFGGLAFLVMSDRDYVDDEFVAKGIYEFLETYSYDTKGGMRRTVRIFHELSVQDSHSF